MVDYKRFYVSVRNSGRVIATEKRKNDIDRRLIKPWVATSNIKLASKLI